MLSAAKHLKTRWDRPFASLRVTRESCHAECSEASQGPSSQTLHFALLHVFAKILRSTALLQILDLITHLGYATSRKKAWPPGTNPRLPHACQTLLNCSMLSQK